MVEATDNLLEKVKIVLEKDVNWEKGSLNSVVKKFLDRRDSFLQLARIHATPMYVLDQQELINSIDEFDYNFQKYIPGLRPYFAMKTNHHPFILKTLIKKGWGIDVSSIREFKLAQKSHCKNFLYTGPGKTREDLLYILQSREHVIINVDSFGELQKLDEVTRKVKKNIVVGVRIITSAHKAWSKFGIPIKDLKKFYIQAKTMPFVKLQGIQFHLSWNESPDPYRQAIKQLGSYLQKNFSKKELSEIKFIDFGGGFLPYKSEGLYPWASPKGAIIKTVDEYFNQKTSFKDKYLFLPSVSLDTYAQGISAAISKYLSFLNCSYLAEPGRIISNSSMHILLRVVDNKNNKLVIADGGINIIGWERFLSEYFPIINLTRPSLTEHECTIAGPLCTPDDLWGYYYYGKTIHEGDILLVPNQGCITYSFAQNFIQPIPPVYILQS